MRMTEDQVIAAIMVTPYRAGGNDLSGMDCWGLIEFWYAQTMDIALTDRCGIEGADSADFFEGYRRNQKWQPAHVPRIGDVAVMPSVFMRDGRRHVVENGHCGVVTRQGILHISETGGARLDSFASPYLKRVRFMRYAG